MWKLCLESTWKTHGARKDIFFNTQIYLNYYLSKAFLRMSRRVPSASFYPMSPLRPRKLQIPPEKQDSSCRKARGLPEDLESFDGSKEAVACPVHVCMVLQVWFQKCRALLGSFCWNKGVNVLQYISWVLKEQMQHQEFPFKCIYACDSLRFALSFNINGFSMRRFNPFFFVRRIYFSNPNLKSTTLISAGTTNFLIFLIVFLL